MDFEGFCFVFLLPLLPKPQGDPALPRASSPTSNGWEQLEAHPTGSPLPGSGPELQAGCRQAAGRLHSLQSPPRARQSLCSALPLRCSPCKGRTWIPPPESPWSELGCGFNRQQEQAAAQPGMLLTLFREEPPLSPTTTGRCPDRAFDGQRT